MSESLTQFWFWAAVLTLASLVWTLRPLLKAEASRADHRGQRLQINRAGYDEQNREIEALLADGKITDARAGELRTENARRFLAESEALEAGAKSAQQSALLWSLLLICPALVVGAYLKWGQMPSVLKWQQITQAGKESVDGNRNMEELVLMLRTRLHQDPEDVEGWYMLARTYLSVGQPDVALQALRRARALAPMEPDYLVATAQALRAVRGDEANEGLNKEIDRSLQQALLLSPQHESALLMTAFRDFESGRFDAAIRAWENLKTSRELDAEAIRFLDEAIERAKAARDDRAAQGAQVASVADAQASTLIAKEPIAKSTVEKNTTVKNTTAKPSAAAPTPALQVTVAPATGVTLPARGKLFVIARPEQGPPVAVVARDLPLSWPVTLQLDDSQSMTAGNPMSGHTRLKIIARLSVSGNSAAASGDFQAEQVLEDWPSKGALALTLAQRLP